MYDPARIDRASYKQMMTEHKTLISDSDTRPLVSVLVYNYNYGRYLKDCLESLVNQTYKNIEINFSDNASTDDSWQVALDFCYRYPEKITVTRNRKNFGADDNFKNCLVNLRGKYFINMCSDDMLEPNYIEECVKTFEINPELAFVMVHRSILNGEKQKMTEAPFYKYSCEIAGPDQAAVYMMAAVNPSVSQIMYSTEKALNKYHTGGLVSRWYGMRLMDFRICMEYPIAYLATPLLVHRIHGENDSLQAAKSLMEVIGPFVLNHQFADIASLNGQNQVADRLSESIIKLSTLCLRYCVRAIKADDEALAKRYFHLALAMSEQIESEDVFQFLSAYWQANKDEKKELIEKVLKQDGLAFRTISYDPPADARMIETSL